MLGGPWSVKIVTRAYAMLDAFSKTRGMELIVQKVLEITIRHRLEINKVDLTSHPKSFGDNVLYSGYQTLAL
jgi:hypothetical protein